MKKLNFIRLAMCSVLFVLMFSVVFLSCAWADGPQQPVTFWGFVQSHKSDILGALFTLLFLLSEYLGQSQKWEANNVWQLATNWLKQKAGK